MESIATIEEENIFDSDNIDEISELKALVRSIKRAKGFSLLFARCNQRPKQIELQEKIISEIPDKNIVVLYFEKGIENLLDELRKRLQKEKPGAVFVYGLESSMPKSEIADKTPFVLNLNASRNAFPSIVDCPVVFWLPDYGIKAIMNGAPDFFSVRSGVFFFETDAEMMSQQISQAISTGYREHDALLLEERKQRIENLKELLAEYQSLPENKRDLQSEYQLKDKLADIYYKTANFSEAERLGKELLNEAKQLNDEETTQQLNNLALVYKAQGKYDDAIKLHQEALLIDEKTIGKEHPNYSIDLSNLALVYRAQGKYDEAIELYQEALLIDEKTIGKEHPNYAIHLSNLAVVYESQGKYDKAIKLHQEALIIDEKTVGIEHPNYANDLNNLALVYYLQGRYEEALPMYEEALRIFMEVLGENHPLTQTVKENLEDCRVTLKKKENGEQKMDSGE